MNSIRELGCAKRSLYAESASAALSDLLLQHTRDDYAGADA